MTLVSVSVFGNGIVTVVAWEGGSRRPELRRHLKSWSSRYTIHRSYDDNAEPCLPTRWVSVSRWDASGRS